MNNAPDVGTISRNQKEMMREILYGLKLSIKNEIEKAHSNLTELSRIRCEQLWTFNKVKQHTYLVRRIKEMNAKGILGMAAWNMKFNHGLEITDKNGLIQIDDKSKDTLKELAELKSIEEVNNFMMTQYLENYDHNDQPLEFSQMLELMERRFKKEFQAKIELIDSTGSPAS